ncbi:MAG: hypothetical protein IRZ28_08700 [Steroidobacteraceae bacterium]|nr:hypothetical protein [Steroidobacteraceae bacterium]
MNSSDQRAKRSCWENASVEKSASASYATGEVNSTFEGHAGALVGANNYGAIERSYATGKVTANNGGEVGGLAGSNANGTITQSYATGDVAGLGSVGGLVGANNNGEIFQTYATGPCPSLCRVLVRTSAGHAGTDDVRVAGIAGRACSLAPHAIVKRAHNHAADSDVCLSTGHFDVVRQVRVGQQACGGRRNGEGFRIHADDGITRVRQRAPRGLRGRVMEKRSNRAQQQCIRERARGFHSSLLD